ncbi:YkgJ family cysteine cluster protein [Capnocytophaga catalasegens]|uniref:Zinc/iron-chelating domain-containing protein n=1 Tax=Capnocytophaga catalasegens TaxID=1004260 RepID=A0AAV5B012_9FLAO|nr:YkgJ family cysteine cluster protein [Capnocytophaga catalasegens]GIZ16610.1 zinc/iron-chelating domain-containing protein [Capnocytophaga catalasegens]GJM51413.1 zinc/iron-chelating domain-containing protein [Capnocytophaga catalasegens]GJM52876.1 zinc/iron-chelating domain-containing protein [Capnocytophaga catalasegens]
MDLDNLKRIATEKQSENKKFFQKLRKKPPKNLDYLTQEIHQQVAEEIDCLSCANCCKTTGPLFTNTDIERVAKHLKMKPKVFIEQYLYLDEDNDYIFQQLPCPFLASDNYCLIYDIRPKACREYPHTDRTKLYQIAQLTIENTKICPIAHQVVELMKTKINR